MRLLLVGLNHRTAPIDVRERFFVPADRVPAVVEALRAEGVAEECVTLSTCNRTECYLTAPESGVAEARVERVLAESAGLPVEVARRHYFRRRGREAVEHLYRVTAGLDSLVVGESEIQGQVAEAYRTTRERCPDSVGPVLHRLFQSALATGGRVRSETRVAHGSASVPAAAVELARKVFGALDSVAVMVVGTGDMGGLTARVLRSEGVPRILVASRSLERAGEAAREVGGEAVAHEEFWARLPELDLIITSTTAGRPFITKERLRDARASRDPLVILDIAVPRNVEASAGELPGVFLYNVDDLERVMEAAERARAEELPVAEEIVQSQAGRFWGWYRARRAVPLIRALRDRAERFRRTELEEALDGLALSAEERERIHVASRAALNKILHAPTATLRELAREPDGEEALEIARRLLGLEEAAGGGGDRGREENRPSREEDRSPGLASGGAGGQEG